MKTLIVALNSKYIHSALAVWYLKANCSQPCTVIEHTINEPIDVLYRNIAEQECDNIAFSCYIWNIEVVLKLAQMLKDAFPNVNIILGGPEVSYDSVDVLNKYEFIDYVICGEGERAFDSLISGDYTAEGITYRTADGVYGGKFQLIENLNSLKSPYTDEMLSKIPYGSIYYEASRGCPFNCGYCLSSTFKGVRRFSIERIKSDIAKICSSGVRQIKFVDRTFNCDAVYSAEFIRWLGENTGDVNLHFEVAADLLTDELINLLGELPDGKVQLEAGVQSMNEHTIEAVSRKTDLSKVIENSKKIMSKGNVHLHLDLIAGLPFEDYQSFKRSFDLVYSVKPHALQLGFLKLLKGSRLRAEKEHNFKFQNFSPYEILSNKYMSSKEILQLKKTEEAVDRYYNSGKFRNTLDYMIKGSAFDFFEMLGKQADFSIPPSADMLYTKLAQIADDAYVTDILKFDFLSTTRFGKLPAALSSGHIDLKEMCFDYLKTNEPENEARERYKQVRLEYFAAMDKYILFDYSQKNPVTGYYKSIVIGSGTVN